MIEELGQQIQKCYRAKVAQESDEDTAIVLEEYTASLLEEEVQQKRS